ncbi:MAG: hypothetical protein WD046_01145 [Paracoccaceae bacterium]
MTGWMGRKLEDFGELLPAEKRVATEMGHGQVVIINPGLPPENAEQKYHLRASFVRYLALGGCERLRPPDKGLRIWGAVIQGDGPEGTITRGLDLEGSTPPGDLWLTRCRFADQLLLRVCNGKNFGFDGSHFAQGIRADGLVAQGNVFLRNVTAKGALRLLGAKLGGDLDCEGASFEAVQDEGGAWGHAFSADGLVAQGSVFLQRVTAKGALRLVGAKLGGDLDCEGASFEVRGGAVALQLQNMEAKGTFLWRKGAKIKGVLSLDHARFGAICDESDCWPKPDMLNLSQCEYGSFAGGKTPVSADARLRWLGLQKDVNATGFLPQPYEQCAKVLRAMGHGADALKVLIEKDRLQRKASRVGLGWARRNSYRVADGLLGLVVDYGLSPLKAFAWLAAVALFSTVLFAAAYTGGAFKPNTIQVLRGDAWMDCAQNALPPQCYMSTVEGVSYPDFNALAYSLDTLLPIVDLEMQHYWIPDERTTFGALIRVALWLQIIAGWALSLLAVAGFSGLIKTDNTT